MRDFVYGAVTLFGAAFQTASSISRFYNSLTAPAHRLVGPATPTWQRHRAITPHRFGLFPLRSPLLRESLLLSFPQGTEMIQVPRLPLLALCVQTRVTGHDPSRVSPFGYPRVKARLTAHRGLSQPATSFVGSQRQGIHRQPFVAWIEQNTLTFVLAMQFSRCRVTRRSRFTFEFDLGRARAPVVSAATADQPERRYAGRARSALDPTPSRLNSVPDLG